MTTTDDELHSPGSLDLFAKFHLSVKDLTAAVNRSNRLEQQRLASLPINYPFSKMSSPGAAVTDLVDFAGPQAGRQWVVRLLTAFASPLAANAASSHLVCGTDSARSKRWKDRKSTRLNSSHQIISYAVFCLKKKK